MKPWAWPLSKRSQRTAGIEMSNSTEMGRSQMQLCAITMNADSLNRSILDSAVCYVTS